MEVHIGYDERYPYFFMVDREKWADGSVEVDDATLERWKRVEAEFDAVQEEMAKAIDY